jgi:hypothetical protein
MTTTNLASEQRLKTSRHRAQIAFLTRTRASCPQPGAPLDNCTLFISKMSHCYEPLYDD